MITTIQKLKQFIYSLEDRQVDQIKIEKQNLKILINKNKNIYNKIISSQTKEILNNTKDIHYKNYKYEKAKNNHKTNNQLTNNLTIQDNDSKTYSTIVSPMVGTFYRSSAPNEQAFIEKNDIVQKKQIVCIIEAMKLMNEIESEVYGEIIEILVNDGDIVDCGQALVKVKII